MSGEVLVVNFDSSNKIWCCVLKIQKGYVFDQIYNDVVDISFVVNISFNQFYLTFFSFFFFFLLAWTHFNP